MKVLHVIPSVGRSSGGPAEVVRRLIPALEQQAVSVTVATTNKDLSQVDQDILHSSTVHFAKCWTRRWTFAPGLFRLIWRELRTADVAHIHSVHTFPTTLALILARLRRVPVLLQPHGALNLYHFRQGRRVKSLYFSTVDRYGLGAVSAALYSSSIELDEGRQALPKVKGAWLPLGVDDQLLLAERVQPESTSVVFLSRMAKKKRLDIFLAALSRLSRDEIIWRGYVAGPLDDDLPYDPRSVVESLGLQEQVEFVGTLDASARLALLRQTDIFVLPSDDESFGMAAAEAMAAGCAVVTSNFVGATIDAADSQSVALVDQNPDVLAATIAHLIENPIDRENLGSLARAYAAQNLSWDSIAERLRTYYESAAQKEEVVSVG
ncbi:glycosyltransferase [uncultured Microbacterium sp.]|uniref:glycosyltransferase n=1 Tax=uncultured Microbacterium sp. TaxID=191216 RepID=UPI0025F88565|nr:glycosyltransferase [uncultured Microbacterium sp.]